jgi:hypothetical protein
MVVYNFRCVLKPHCIRCSHFKVDDVGALEPSSKPPVRIVEDDITASLHQQRFVGQKACKTQSSKMYIQQHFSSIHI